jgi:hypothetical protein
VHLRSIVVVVLIVLALAAPGAAQNRFSIRYIPVRTASAVVLDRFSVLVPPRLGAGTLRDNLSACAAFHNTDPRTATAVRIEAVFYNDRGTRKYSQLLTRTGTFGTGVMQGGNGDSSVDNCFRLHLPDADDIAVAFYIDSVDYADGSTWVAEGLTLPDRALPGTLVPAPVIPPSPSTVTQLPPEVVAVYPSCAVALAVAADPPIAGTIVGVQPGPPIGEGLYHIGDATVCRPTANAAADSEALAAVQALPAAIVRGAAFRVIVPELAYPPACVAPVRLLHRQLVERPGSALGPPPSGEYVAVAHVDVRLDGYPGNITIVRSSNRPEFDAALRLSAGASRYVPAIVHGTPAFGAYDFAMRWVVETSNNGHVSTRTFGPSFEPLPAGCAT